MEICISRLWYLRNNKWNHIFLSLLHFIFSHTFCSIQPLYISHVLFFIIPPTELLWGHKQSCILRGLQNSNIFPNQFKLTKKIIQNCLEHITEILFFRNLRIQIFFSQFFIFLVAGSIPRKVYSSWKTTCTIFGASCLRQTALAWQCLRIKTTV
jgi:hypothetical protein